MNITTVNNTKVELMDSVFAVEYNEPLVHQVVVAYQAGARQGTSSQKSRSEVNRTGAKPWRQKGTGRARAGDAKSPIWRGGGVTFASKTRDYSQKVNRKMYRKAIASILSELIRQDRLVVVDDFELEQPKTKLMVARLKELGLFKALIVLDDIGNDNVYLALRNIPNIYLCTQSLLDPYSLLAADKVCITVEALKKLQERIQ